MGTAIRRLALGIISVIQPWCDELQGILSELRTVPLPALSSHLTAALIEGEDHRFRTHVGVDLWAIARALINTALMGQRQGASTIQQQLVRVMSQRRELTIRRKIREMVLAIALGRYLSQDQILIFYLVRGYYGYGMPGLFQACDKLRINPAVASPVEAASLVARLKYPEPQSKSAKQQERIQRRTRHILRRITQAHTAKIGKTQSPAESAAWAPGQVSAR